MYQTRDNNRSIPLPIADPEIQAEIFDKFNTAKEILHSRVLGEPFNFHLVANRIRKEMFSYDDKNILAAIEQFNSTGRYSAYSICAANGKLDYLASTSQLSQQHQSVTLVEAFDVFERLYSQYREIEIAAATLGMVRKDMTTPDIIAETTKLRKGFALIGTAAQSDGKEEFEKGLVAFIDGVDQNYPVKPPTKLMRAHCPFLEPTDYVIIAGRTGMGKSYLGLNFLYEVAVQGYPCSYYNLENQPKDVWRRLWQMKSGIKYGPNLKDLSDEGIKKAVDDWEYVRKLPLKSHSTGRSLHVIVNTIRQDYYDRGIKLAVIDYVQLMKDATQRRGRVEEIEEISAELRSLALDLKIPIVGIAQISREAERSANKRPTLVDLKGSGALEQDATAVWLIYRPSYYDITEDENGNAYPPGYAEIHFAKGRNTGTGRAECRFNEIRGFYDPEPAFETGKATSRSFLADHQPQPIDYSIPAGARPGADQDIPF